VIDLPPYSSKSESKIVYLDQKCWINLAKIYYGNPTNSEKKILGKIFNASDNGSAIFPISIYRFEETINRKNPRNREQLASLMMKISKWYCFTPFYDRIVNGEVWNIILEKLNLPKIDLREKVLGKGIGHLLGAKPEIHGDIPEDLRQELLDMIDEPETIIKIISGFDSLYTDELNQNYRIAHNLLERNRQKLRQIRDKEKRRKAFLGINFSAMITPKIATILHALQFPVNFIIKENFSERDFEDLLDKIPTALCLFTLIFQRDQEYHRPIKKNDFNDIASLTLAIPYSDIVITDKMMASIATRMKLDDKCDTIILKSISELEEYL